MAKHPTERGHWSLRGRLGELTQAEADVLVRLQRAARPAAGVVLPAARGLSHFGEHSLGWLGLAGAGMLLDRRRRRQWGAVGLAAFLSHAASVIIKRVIRRPRPHDERLEVGVKTPSQLSFPSSHATSTAAALAAAAMVVKNPWPLAGIPVMMLSRMVVGVHYPIDVTAGAALGAATAGAVMAMEKETR